MSCTLYHLLLATLAALMLSGCSTTGGGTSWSPFQRKTEVDDTLSLSTNPEVEATLKQRQAARNARNSGGAAATAQAASAPAASSSSWLPSWMPFSGSSAATKQPAKSANPNAQAAAKKGDAGHNLDDCQVPVGNRMAKARDLERAGQYDKARIIYEDLIRQYPRAPEPYHRLGIVADKEGRYRQAQELLIQSLQLDPRNANVRIDLGYCFYMQGQLPQAEAETRAALQLDPRDERAHNNLGLILGAMDRMPEALEHFRRGGSEADAQFNLAFVYAARSDLPAAKECFQRALDINPHHEKARKAMNSFETYESQPEEIRLAMEQSFGSERRGTIPFVEPGTVIKASAEGSADGATSPTTGGVMPAIGGAKAGGSRVPTPREASNAIHGLYQQARSHVPVPSQGE